MKKKRCYQILGKKSRYLFGVFARNKDGHNKAKSYKKTLEEARKEEFIIK